MKPQFIWIKDQATANDVLSALGAVNSSFQVRSGAARAEWNGRGLEIYGGSSDIRAQGRDAIAAQVEKMEKQAKARASASEPATERQVAYMIALLADDYPAATTFGLNHQNVHTLTKSEASRMITLIKQV